MRTEYPTRYKGLNFARFRQSEYWHRLDQHIQRGVTVAATMLPFRTNEYVLEELINWNNIPADPIFQLTVPQRGMLDPDDFERLSHLIFGSAEESAIIRACSEIRHNMNPHPAGQTDHNVPELDGRQLNGMQHKYSETLLYFPGAARSCHAYCTFCFRWPLIVQDGEHDFARPRIDDMCSYVEQHPEITDILFTGGDPMVMSASLLRKHIEPLLGPRYEHVQNIRIGTKSVSYWPQRFVSDADADDILRLFEQIVAAGKHISVMGHYNHPVELSTEIAQAAMRRICSTGATLRMQAPLVRRINDHPHIWSELWQEGVKLGAVPYYMFVERDTGPNHYFEVPLVRALDIYQEAFRNVSGLAKTVRGPSMSAFFGKVRVIDVREVAGKQVFALEYIQSRDPEYTGNLFFADFDPAATWFDDLDPAFESDRPYFIFDGTDLETKQKTA